MPEREIQAQASSAKRDGFRPLSPGVEERIRLYPYAVSLDGMRYRVTLKTPLNKSNPQAHLLTMKEEDFFSVSRDGRQIEPSVFLSAYCRFFRLADSEHSHTIEVFHSFARL